MLSKVNSQISSKFVAAISKHIVPFRSMLRNSNNECRDKVATWGLDHLFPPSSTSSSNLIHLKNCKIRIIIADIIGIKIRSEFQTKKGLPTQQQKDAKSNSNLCKSVQKRRKNSKLHHPALKKLELYMLLWYGSHFQSKYSFILSILNYTCKTLVNLLFENFEPTSYHTKVVQLQ